MVGWRHEHEDDPARVARREREVDQPRLLRCPSGRRLAVQFSGDLDGSPVLFFHGTPGSRLFVPPEEVSRQEHAWVVTVDRPGYGLSDAAPAEQTIAAV